VVKTVINRAAAVWDMFFIFGKKYDILIR